MMKTWKPFRRAVAAVLLAGGLCGPGPARAILKSAGDEKVVLQAAKRCGASLSSGDRPGVEEALLARAWDAGVVVCHDRAASPGPPAFAAICAQPGPEVAPLWWDLKIETPRREGTRVASATLRLALSDGPPREAPEIFLLGPFVLPPGVTDAAAPAEALRVVTASLRSSPAVLDWLRGLSSRPGLLRVRAADAPPEAAAGPSAWSAEILRITDLLIDGDEWQAREAEERADRLLRDPRLPADLAARARELKKKAAAKLESAAASNPPDPPAAPPPAATPPAAPPAAASARGEEPVAGHPDKVFPARTAVAGKGFGAGSVGQLRLTPEGIAFERKGQGAREWSMSWTDLVSASRDDGLWESPFTLLLVERTGRKRYLSLIDGHGRYVAGDPLLNAIAAGKKAFRQGEKP